MALAINATLAAGYRAQAYTTGLVLIRDRFNFWRGDFAFPDQVITWITLYDAGVLPQPFSFSLSLPEHCLAT